MFALIIKSIGSFPRSFLSGRWFYFFLNVSPGKYVQVPTVFQFNLWRIYDEASYAIEVMWLCR